MSAFYRTKPINTCEMGILCLKDSVRLVNGRKLKDKDGYAFARGKGTVTYIDGKFCQVYFWINGGKTVTCHVDDIFKTGR